MTDALPASAPEPALERFSSYQKFIAGLLAFLQFAVILDFMVMSPLGAMIMPALQIGPSQFGTVVSAYAFSAGISGLLTAGFADRFDRKRLLLFFYAGFVLATLGCALAPTFEFLLVARVLTGFFAGVIGSVVMAIATDLYAPHLRGRVIGVIQTAFAASQVLGLPTALYLSNHWDWHAPFMALVIFGVLGGLVIALRMRPVADHLKLPQEKTAFMHLVHTLSEPRYLMAFATTGLLSTGGFMLMPFGSAFVVNNLGISMERLPTLYLITGLCTIFVTPLVGRACDKFGRLQVFMGGSTLTVLMVLIYTHLQSVPFYLLVIVNIVMFVGIFSRMIPFQALATSVPEVNQRGAFNAIGSSIQSLSGGVASLVAGHLVSMGADGKLHNFPVIGYVVVGTTALSVILVWQVQLGIRRHQASLAVAS